MKPTFMKLFLVLLLAGLCWRFEQQYCAGEAVTVPSNITTIAQPKKIKPLILHRFNETILIKYME